MNAAPANGLSALQERALDLIGSRSDGLRQSELWRLLCIDSRRCSRIVSRMEIAGLIRREKIPSSRTYLIKLSCSRPGKTSFRYIDSYLTEIYLLFLSRGISH